MSKEGVPAEGEKKQETPGERPLEETIAGQIAQKHGKLTSEVVIKLSDEKEGFAYGLVGFAGEMGGGMWFAAKTEKGWELAFDGNGIIPCDPVNKYGFPVDMIPKCVDKDELIER